MKKWLIGLILIFLGGWGWIGHSSKIKGEVLRVGESEIVVEIRDTELERNQGLSGRENLKENEGMLFVFEKPGIYGFWMKEMKFDLDFIWILNDRVVEITEAVPAPKMGEKPASLKPKQVVDMVLEVNSGLVARKEIKVGAEAKLLLVR